MVNQASGVPVIQAVAGESRNVAIRPGVQGLGDVVVVGRPKGISIRSASRVRRLDRAVEN